MWDRDWVRMTVAEAEAVFSLELSWQPCVHDQKPLQPSLWLGGTRTATSLLNLNARPPHSLGRTITPSQVTTHSSEAQG